MGRVACECLDLRAAMEPQLGKWSASAVGSLGGCRDEQGCGCLASGGFDAARDGNILGLDSSPKQSLFPAAKAAGTVQSYRAQHPPTLHMVKEALRAHDEKKGASVVAIKRFILAKYPTVDPIRLKYLLKQALIKGLSCGELVRPHNSSAVGATGTFKVSKGCWSHRAGDCGAAWPW